MRSIHQIISRAAVLAAAGLVAVSLSARTASATTIYSTGFETPTFTAGAVSGQGNFVQFLTGSGGSTAVVQTSNVITGLQSVTIQRNAGDVIGVAPHTIVAQAAPFTVTAQVDIKIPTFAGTAGNGPDFGLDLVGNNGATGIGGLYLDASNGNIFDTSNGNSNFLLSDGSVGAPSAVTADTVHTLKIVASFAGGTSTVGLEYFLDGTSIDTETTTGTLSSFDFAYLEGLGGIPSGDQANSAIFDNYSVDTTAAVPEPTSLAVVGVAGMLLSVRRSRRASVAGN